MDENNNLTNSQGDDNKTQPAQNTPSVPAKNENSTDKRDKRMLALIITAGIITVIVLGLIIISIVKVSSIKPEEVPSTNTEYTPVSEQVTSNENTNASVSVTYETIPPETTSEVQQTAVPSTVQNVTKNQTVSTTAAKSEPQNVQTTQVLTVEGLPPLEKTGDNILSDSPDNEYIKFISEKKKIDPSVLVAIYAVPDNGNNFVLEFDGNKDSNGKIIKSPDTLIKIYQIDKNKKIKTATVNGIGNSGVGYAEGKLVFYMVTNIVMPQYPDYFTGIK